MTQRAEIPRHQDCYACSGTGACPATGGNCLTCHGEAVVCVLCRRPPSECDCPAGDIRTASNEIKRTRFKQGGDDEND